MKKILTVLLTTILSLSLLSGCGGNGSSASQSSETDANAVTTQSSADAETTEAVTEMSYQLGDAVDDFTVELCDGTTVSLKGMLETKKCVMINVWATWCGPCRMEFPYMDEAYADYKDEVGLVCLSSSDDNEAVAAFKEENGLKNLPMGADTIGASGFVLEGIPTTVIIDRFGNYVYYECGSLTDVSDFTRMWDIFISDDYTESKIYEEIPGPKYEGEYPDDKEVAAAFSQDGSVSFANDKDDEYAWPFMPGDNGADNSNVLVRKTFASATAKVKAKAGDVFAMDYVLDSELADDFLQVRVNDEIVKALTGKIEGTVVYSFEKDGDYTVNVKYEQMSGNTGTASRGTVKLSNAALLTGDAAMQKLASLPRYPFSLEGEDYAVEPVSESAKRIVIDDPAGFIKENYSDLEYYIIPEETGKFRIRLGDAYDPESSIGYGDFDGNMSLLSQMEMDKEGYLFEAALSSVEAGSYNNTYVFAYPDVKDFGKRKYIYVFRNEENVNHFLANDATDEEGNPIEGAFWTYEDGTKPSTDKLAEEPNADMYKIILVDQNGDPVDGKVMVNVCTDETCQPQEVTGGYYGFTPEAPYPYVIHILSAPDGYTPDTEAEYVFEEEGGTLTIEIPKD